MLVMALPRNAGNNTVEATWPQRDVDVEACWQQYCRVMLATTLPGQLGRNVMKMPSHAGDSATKACW
jgi:hypothetical protein